MRVCSNCNEQNPERARFCLACGAPLSDERPTFPETRKTVTVVFCDVAESTRLGERLDPEALRQVMSRYYGEARTAFERHGGTVEKFIGDAVMAVFGIPVVHEDDALRALRAAVDFRAAVEILNTDLERAWGIRIGIRTGVNTGEVIAGDPSSGQAFATGHAVVVAERLEKAAGVSEILMGEATARLAKDAISAEPVAPLDLKGTRAPVAASRLLEIDAGVSGTAHRLDSPLVGRADELDRLLRLFDEVVATRTCRVVTVVGEAGVGKSRLARELITAVAERALVVEGRCLPYGTGITYWPVVEIVRSIAGLSAVEPPDRVRARIVGLLADDPEAPLVAERVADALGVGADTSESAEIYWGVRRLFEALASQRPLLVLLDDIQWAEQTFLDFVEYLAGWSSDVPILITCLARTDLAEVRPAWGKGSSFENLALEPLSAEDARQLVAKLFAAAPTDDATITSVARTTGGNPLFAEETVRMLIDETGGRANGRAEPTMPATIQAVLAARLDGLTPAERGMLQRAAVIGEVFWWGAVAELSPAAERADVRPRLQALVRKALIRPHDRTFLGEDAFAFGHILVRDAAYDSIPKRLRAELHERFAEWVEGRAAGDGEEHDEILGYHLEQAYHYRSELGRVGAAELALAGRASERLSRAGRRAFRRGDMPAAASLLHRSASLRQADDPDHLRLLLESGIARRESGDFAGSLELFDRILTSAPGPELEASTGIERATSRLVGGAARPDELLAAADRAAEIYEAIGHEAGLAHARYLLSFELLVRGRFAAAERALEAAREYAVRAGDEAEEARILTGLATQLMFGSTPADEAVRRCSELVDRLHAVGTGAAPVATAVLAGLEAMTGRVDEGWSLYASAKRTLADRGVKSDLLNVPLAAAPLLWHDPAEAERELRAAYEMLEAVGGRGPVSIVTAFLASAILAQGRIDDAEQLTHVSERATWPEDVVSRIIWQGVRARTLARRGEHERASRLGRAAVELSLRTDSPLLQAEALLALADVHGQAGRRTEASTTARRACALYEAKGDVLGARRARGLLDVELDVRSGAR
jgi:class 3 adenylate cyclase/tetratricopeptide (TPR) repeat protein